MIIEFQPGPVQTGAGADRVGFCELLASLDGYTVSANRFGLPVEYG